MQHNASWLRDYLVSGVEDPRINLQSILSRHFLTRELSGNRFDDLMDQEYRFSAVMNWLFDATREFHQAGEYVALLRALERQADKFEGLPIPGFARHTFAQLQKQTGASIVPNYIAGFLENGKPNGSAQSDTFMRLWTSVLTAGKDTGPNKTSGKLSVLEPACGSANDYRFLDACGLGCRLDYTGLDICRMNVENARALYPAVRFDIGNVFEIKAPNRSYDLCFVHDLLEHLSPEGLNKAVEEMCRVTRRALCVGFFNMDEIPEHFVQPLDEYHWNRLSMNLVRELFEQQGFQGRVIHLGSFLRQLVGCEHTHNPYAYTFIQWRNG
jgi:hypothetical protein